MTDQDLPEEFELSPETCLTLIDTAAGEIQDLMLGDASLPEEFKKRVQRLTADIRGYVTEVEIALEDA